MAARTTHITIHRQPWIKKQLLPEFHAFFGDGELVRCHVLGQRLEELLRAFEQGCVVFCPRRRERDCEHCGDTCPTDAEIGHRALHVSEILTGMSLRRN